MIRACLFLFGTALAIACGASDQLLPRRPRSLRRPGQIRIDILRWSTDAERDRLMDAWMLKTANPARPRRWPGGWTRCADARSWRGEALRSEAYARSDAGNGVESAPTVGYLWSREVAGYAIRYAARIANPDGSERVVIITESAPRRGERSLAAFRRRTPALRFLGDRVHLNSHGTGEGKTSLTGKVAPDAALKMVALENYDGLPVVFSAVQQRKGIAVIDSFL